MLSLRRLSPAGVSFEGIVSPQPPPGERLDRMGGDSLSCWKSRGKEWAGGLNQQHWEGCGRETLSFAGNAVGKREAPDGCVWAIPQGGPRMEAAGIRSLVPMASLAVMGFAELLPRLLHLRSALNITVAAASAQPLPDAVVTVDYKGFNLRLLVSARPLGSFWLSTFAYSCPCLPRVIAREGSEGPLIHFRVVGEGNGVEVPMNVTWGEHGLALDGFPFRHSSLSRTEDD